jgi:hypothetical protein
MPPVMATSAHIGKAAVTATEANPVFRLGLELLPAELTHAAHSPCLVFFAWQDEHSDCQFRGSQNSFMSPRCGRM